ncbi:MAG: hypothetical protein EP330_04970 [Deltaproteobacteria bacterium]|nr:MAG: hypothetical protein EP330_04970 [Deltaproteobacteria bacterium]
MAPPPLPSGPALVRATLLLTAVVAHRPAQAQETAPVEVAPAAPLPDAPTCGPCCHGASDCDDLMPVIEQVAVPNIGTLQWASTAPVVVVAQTPFVRGDVILAVNGAPVASLDSLAGVFVQGPVSVQRGADRIELWIGEPLEVAPTCGPCCHGSSDCDELVPPPPEPLDPKAEKRARRDAARAERKARRQAD